MVKRAIIAGASGLTGSCLLGVLLDKPGYDEVLILVRKELPLQHNKLRQLIVDFDKIEEYAQLITGDIFFSLLGSTKKKTPDLKEYRKIDHDYAIALAQIALINKISQFHLMSSIGADVKASNFYTSMKGETENDVIKLGLPTLHIYRPSALVGKRNENRPMEKIAVAIMRVINPLLFGRLKKYQSIRAATVAGAMYKQSLKNKPGVHIYSSDKIKELS